MPSNIKTIILLYVSLVLIWALTPLSIVWSVEEIPRMWSLVLRFVLAAPLIVVILLVMGIKLPLNRTALHSYLAGSFSLIVSQLFTYFATEYMTSGAIALLFGFAPIMAGLITLVLYRQNLATIQWLGMVLGIAGLYVSTMTGDQTRISPTGLVLMFFAILAYTVSIFWVKHINARIVPLAQASGSIIMSMLLALTIVPFIWTDAPTTIPGAKSIVALGYLVIASSVLAMFCYFNLMQRMSATTISLATVITPVLAISFGILLNNEPYGMHILSGTGLVIAGLLLYFYRELMRLFAHRK